MTIGYLSGRVLFAFRLLESLLLLLRSVLALAFHRVVLFDGLQPRLIPTNRSRRIRIGGTTRYT